MSIKSFILNSGEKMLAIGVVIGLTASVIMALSTAYPYVQMENPVGALIMFLIIAIIGMTSFPLQNWVMKEVYC